VAVGDVSAATAGAGATAAITLARRAGVHGVVRELRSWPTLLLVSFCLVVGVPVTVALTPDQQVVALGQHLAVGARTPTPTLAGPAQLVQIGNTALDLPRLRVAGPLRPRLVIGPVQRNAEAARVFDPQASAAAQGQARGDVARGFLRWYLWGGLGLLLFTIAAAAGAGCLRMLAVLRTRSRAGQDPTPHDVAEIWHHLSGAIARMTAIAVAVSTLAWLGAGGLAYGGTVRGLAEVRSLIDLVGSVSLSPPPAGPPVTGFTGAVIGDSRAVRVGGPPLGAPEPPDIACGRSTDSLAAEVGSLLDTPVLNLACPSATVAVGLLGPQERSGLLLPAQVGVLKQAQDLRFVAVAIGPNDVGWSDLVTYCYAVENCTDNLSRGEFDYRLAAFDRDYGILLGELAALPGQPQVVVVSSYDVLPSDADPACADLRGPADAAGLSPLEIELLDARTDELNAILAAGAQKYGFTVAQPRLVPLCAPDAAARSMGPDLQGLIDPYPFHPTGVGSLRTAAAVARLVVLDRGPG
jgi:hypothetical protein